MGGRCLKITSADYRLESRSLNDPQRYRNVGTISGINLFSMHFLRTGRHSYGVDNPIHTNYDKVLVHSNSRTRLWKLMCQLWRVSAREMMDCLTAQSLRQQRFLAAQEDIKRRREREKEEERQSERNQPKHRGNLVSTALSRRVIRIGIAIKAGNLAVSFSAVVSLIFPRFQLRCSVRFYLITRSPSPSCLLRVVSPSHRPRNRRFFSTRPVRRLANKTVKLRTQIFIRKARRKR